MAMKRITGATKGNKKVVRKSPRPAKKRAKTRGSVDMEAMQIRRMRMVGGLLTSVLIAVISTCGYLQGCEAEAFKAEAERNYLRALGIDTQRGDIYDRNGEALATSVEVDTVYANPREVTEPAEVAEQLSDILDIDVETLMRRLTGDGAFRYIKRQVTAEESER
ncbi:MAG: cell division protein FtsI (penicillin-binding protein 3), partial [Myxococcota bacterium]